jgi:hypothetical protein
MKKLALSLLTTLSFAMPMAHAEEILDFTPLIRDFVPGGKKEVALPYLKYTDANLDGMPESVSVYFNVFTAGTTAKLHNSLPRNVVLPALPCGNPYLDSIEDDMKLKFMGTASASRVHMVLTGMVGCWDMTAGEWREAFKTIVYSTDASTAANSWIRVWDLDTAAANGIDINDDGTNELMITMLVPVAPTGERAKVVILNGGNGTTYNDGELYDDAYGVTNGY